MSYPGYPVSHRIRVASHRIASRHDRIASWSTRMSHHTMRASEPESVTVTAWPRHCIMIASTQAPPSRSASHHCTR
eukprot:1483269-Rhodomonas_salina.1